MFHVDVELDELISKAKSMGASDIHCNAIAEGLAITYRIDGILRPILDVPREVSEQLTNRIKVLSGLDIGEKRLPQDGRWYHGPSKVTMRVSTLPSLHGESIVCRLMGSVGAHRTLEELGMTRPMEEAVMEMLQKPYGLILVCGATGAGKTATLYALLRRLDLEREHIISLENPVEADLEGIVQVEVQPKGGITFESGLRAIVRQDPDTIMVGEIRDKETAVLAIQAALTGHRVLATLHTSRVHSIKERLIHMGVEPYLVEATLTGGIAQMLVRRWNGHDYAGRIGVFEILKGHEVVCTLESSGQDLLAREMTTVEEIKRLGLLQPERGDEGI